jgi:hypothetical protein
MIPAATEKFLKVLSSKTFDSAYMRVGVSLPGISFRQSSFLRRRADELTIFRVAMASTRG